MVRKRTYTPNSDKNSLATEVVGPTEQSGDPLLFVAELLRQYLKNVSQDTFVNYRDIIYWQNAAQDILPTQQADFSSEELLACVIALIYNDQGI